MKLWRERKRFSLGIAHAYQPRVNCPVENWKKLLFSNKHTLAIFLKKNFELSMSPSKASSMKDLVLTQIWSEKSTKNVDKTNETNKNLVLVFEAFLKSGHSFVYSFLFFHHKNKTPSTFERWEGGEGGYKFVSVLIYFFLITWKIIWKKKQNIVFSQHLKYYTDQMPQKILEIRSRISPREALSSPRAS